MRKIVTVLAALTVGLALTGCAPETKVSTKPGSPSGSASAKSSSGEDGDNNVTQVGQWATAEDGITFRVSSLKRGRVSDIASGGHPGDPAVVVAVQFRNGAKSRIDLTMVDVKVRVGADGSEAEQVFQDGFDGGFDGTLAPGRTASARYMFAAGRVSDLKAVSVEIAPGVEYDSATFEGSI